MKYINLICYENLKDISYICVHRYNYLLTKAHLRNGLSSQPLYSVLLVR